MNRADIIVTGVVGMPSFGLSEFVELSAHGACDITRDPCFFVFLA
jgi:hypothetical protein